MCLGSGDALCTGEVLDAKPGEMSSSTSDALIFNAPVLQRKPVDLVPVIIT
jgi:hypothetical protein